MTKVKSLITKARISLNNFLTPVPEIEEEYIDKMVYLLRRDFDTETQNNILLSVGKKLSAARDQDMRKMEEDYKVLQQSHLNLNSRIAFQ
jgi:hypothetical protein